MTQALPHLDGLGDIPADYEHVQKNIVPGDELAVPGGLFKWYDVHRDGQEVAKDVRDEAREYLRDEAAAGRLGLRGELGFILNHRAGDKYFVLVGVWRNNNEFWQTLYFKDDAGFQPYPVPDGAPRPTQEVVELDATSHERRAWSRYLTSARDEAAKRAYIEDRCTGILV
ncbi:hypothetical protein ACFZCY_26180 [Streptomyces sp. NPDC007983]|uniref:hypothetical protein n=1 Tax=Streptomyces sp. NPDC007983 TaxID=3364800 RepID=UPI0036E5696E